jgi:hypothetical protein
MISSSSVQKLLDDVEDYLKNGYSDEKLFTIEENNLYTFIEGIRDTLIKILLDDN